MIKKIESESIEYKESISEKKEAGKTLVSFANKNGGKIFFGIKDDGIVVGINEIKEKTVRELTQFFTDNTSPPIYPTVSNILLEGKDVIEVKVSDSTTPYHTFKEIPYIRVGPTTKKMSQVEYQERLLLYKSTNRDFSSTIVRGCEVRDLSKEALKVLRKLLKESGRYKVKIDELSDKQLLKDLLLIRDGCLTIAALVLLAEEKTLAKFLPYCEIRFGYKSNESEIRNNDTEIYKGGYLLNYEKVWEKINARNTSVNIPYKMRLLDRKAFDENSLREAINNAVAHRDYQKSASIFIIQYPKKIIIKSPGGLPDGVTVENIIDESKPRNKLIADILFKCELVEQFGNGVNLMYENQLSLGKSPPSFIGTNSNNVELTLDGSIQDVEFAKYVLKVAEKKQKKLNDRELIVLNRINNKQKLNFDDKVFCEGLLDLGLIEKVGYEEYILSKQYYEYTHKEWEYTKRKGLSKDKNKQLIIQHLENFGRAKKEDFSNLLDHKITPRKLYSLLNELKKENIIYFDGPERSRKAFWKLVSNKS